MIESPLTFFWIEEIKEYEKEIAWTQQRKLSWEDFKKIGQDEGLGFDAVSHCGILAQSGRMHALSSGKVFVSAVFYTNNSWVNPQSKTPELLAHEQLHFDLSELYARKMRKAFSEADLNGQNVIVLGEFIHQKYSKELMGRQELYDEETNHSKDIDAQKKWNKMVKQELDELNNYQF